MDVKAVPSWVNELREIFRADVISQFVLSGNVHDYIPHEDEQGLHFYTMGDYLSEIIFKPFDVVIFYDRSKGIRVRKGSDHFFQFLNLFDRFHGSQFAGSEDISKNPIKSLDSPGMLPRQPTQAFEIIDRFLNYIATAKRSQNAKLPSVAIVINYANFVFPRGESLYMSGDIGSNVIKLIDWAKDASVNATHSITVLISENLNDVNDLIITNPYIGKIKIDLPDEQELNHYIVTLIKDESDFIKLCSLPVDILASKLVGLNRINVKNLILRAVRNQLVLDEKRISQIKKDIIEEESGGLLEFFESKRNFADVAGHDEAKAWLLEDAALMKKGELRAMPMGYLITGRIGTGKTYLIQCFAGECGIPFVELKNFRDKWVGATEGNLEKIFNILHALGQVVVFVDEADQATGRRESGAGDSGLSGRIYGMLAKEMSDTANRGRILWIFATSRPDLLEVDLKRPGRLDIHIPLFPPQTAKAKKELFAAMAKKLKIVLKNNEIPDLPFEDSLSGNEIESLLIRTMRLTALQDSNPNKRKSFSQILKTVMSEFRPSAHKSRLEFMDLLAVKECTDARFLPEKYRKMTIEEIDRKINDLNFL